jgi:hypothetical protein
MSKKARDFKRDKRRFVSGRYVFAKPLSIQDYSMSGVSNGIILLSEKPKPSENDFKFTGKDFFEPIDLSHIDRTISILLKY